MFRFNAEVYNQRRMTISTAVPFKTVIDRLYASIGHPSTAADWLKRMAEVHASSLEMEEKAKIFVRAVKEQVGEDDFMAFGEIDHGAWLPLFGIRSGGVKRIVLGNPLIAETMIRHEITAGLAVPVEILVVERDYGTDVVWNEPSQLVMGAKLDNELLNRAANILDVKLQRMIEKVCA